MKWYHYTIIGLTIILIATQFPPAKVKGAGEIANVFLGVSGLFLVGIGFGCRIKDKH